MKKLETISLAWLVIFLSVSLLPLSATQIRQAKAVDQPTTTTETKFVVYPDGWVSIGALVNQTYPSSYPSQPSGYATIEFLWDGGVLKASANSVYTLPQESVKDFPLNSTDLSLLSDYHSEELEGNVTVIIAGYPVSTIDFTANKTQIDVTGTAVVPFFTLGTTTLDKTMVIQGLNFLKVDFMGRGPSSLWNKTDGSAECVLFTNTTSFYTNYASVVFHMQIQGNITEAMSRAWRLFYYGPSVPGYSDLESLLYRALNSLLSVVERDTIQLAYTHSDRKLVYRERTTFGDLNTVLNNLKVLALTSYWAALGGVTPEQLPWQVTFVNETSIDISHSKFSLNVTTHSAIYSWEDLRVQSPRDVINATHFKLKRFFNLTNPAPSPPTSEIPMKITVEAGSNITHTVSLHRPSNVPVPDSTTGSTLMIWNSQRISGIQDLTFKIEPLITGPTNIGTVTDPASVTESNPLTIDASQTAGTTLTIEGISAPTTIVVRGTTEAPSNTKPAPGTFSLLGNYVEITASEEVEVTATIRISYTTDQLAAAGLDESSLKIYHWDAELEQWVAVETHVNTAEHYAWAEISSFSVWGLFGQAPGAETQWWLYAIIAVVVIAVVAGGIVLMRRRKPSPPPTPSTVPARPTETTG